MRNAKNNAHSQYTARSTQHRTFVAALTMLHLLAAMFLLLTGSAALADEDIQKEVIAATAAWAEAFNARDAQRIAALYAGDAMFWGTISHPPIRALDIL